MTDGENNVRSRWAQAWPDALAFVVGLGLVWQFQWETRDLVWSLWLSSAVIGYAMIVWSIFGPAVSVATKAWRERENLRGTRPSWGMGLGAGVLAFGGLFLLAFFTVHFGMFHFVHSIFLNSFFPVEPALAKSFPGPSLYWEVFQRYWWFLPAAAIAERAAFRLAPAEPMSELSLRPLSRREVQCAYWLSEGLRAKQIADILELSVHTVRQYIDAASQKLSARNRGEMILRASALGLVAAAVRRDP
jgi:DNA-binding CsgD family transcriptional regulator